MSALAELKAVTMRVTGTTPFGGGQIEIPILMTGTIDRAMTSGKGKGALDVTDATLREIAANFERFNRPVPVGFDQHLDFGERAGPQPAFIVGLRVKGSQLLALVDLGPAAFEMIVTQGSVRGFSVEMAKDRKTPTSTIAGWSLHGGIFTNRPAAEIHFAPPLEDAVAASCVVNLSFRPERQEDTQVAEQTASLEQLQAEVETKDAKITSLSASLEEVSGQRDTANEELATVTRKLEKATEDLAAATAIKKTKESYAADLEQRVESLETKFSEVQAENAELKKAQKSEQIRSIVLKAIREGRNPKTFDGYKDDPVAWMKDALGTESVSALERFVAAIPIDPKLAKKASVSSGVAQFSDDDDADSKTPEQIEEEEFLATLGIDAAFANASGESEALAIQRAKQKTK